MACCCPLPLSSPGQPLNPGISPPVPPHCVWGICQSASWRRVVLVELAEQGPAVCVEASLELGVGERRHLAAGEAYDSSVERVVRREEVRRFAPGRGVRLFTSTTRPVFPLLTRRRLNATFLRSAS